MDEALGKVLLAVMALALLLSFFRLLRGPSLPDRVVALDLVALIVSGMLLISASSRGAYVLVDVAIVISVIGFVSTLAYAFYVERRGT